MPHKTNIKLMFISLIVICLCAFSPACINTRSADARVTLFVTMVKSGNFKDALTYVDSKPFTKSVLKKIALLPDAALLEILKLSKVADEVKNSFLTDSEAKMSELKKSIQDLMANDPNIVEMTLKEMSAHIQNKDIDVIAQNLGETTGEVHVRFSETGTHSEVIVFYVAKIENQWQISAMEEIITGWIY